PPPCPLLVWANERTKAILSATLDILGNVPPSVMPGTFVVTSPVTLRYSLGADILGSNVSMCVGPPPSHTQTTEVSFTSRPAAAAWARAANRPGKLIAPIPSEPILMNSRRVVPSQSRNLRFVNRLSTTVLLVQRGLKG